MERHHYNGNIARQRTRDGATIFSNLEQDEIKRVVKGAYGNIDKKVKSQGDKIVVRGSFDGWNVEFWVNKKTKQLETAYPYH